MSVPAEIEELIEGAPLSAHVATSVDDRPHVAPVWYRYADGVVSFVTGGRKLENLRANPRVAISIERATPERVHWTVTLLGTARVVGDGERIAEFDRYAFETYYEPGGASDDVSGEQVLVDVDVASATARVY